MGKYFFVSQFEVHISLQEFKGLPANQLRRLIGLCEEENEKNKKLIENMEKPK